MKRVLSVVTSAVILLCIAGCSGGGTHKERFTKSFLDLFDTASTITAYDESQESFDEHYEQFYNELKTYDNLFDIYHSYEGINNLYVVNRDGANSPVKVDEKIIDLLEYGKEIYKLSDGKTNICMGSVLALWHAERELSEEQDARLPDMEKLKEAGRHTDINDLIIDRENSTVFFKDPEMKLDVGAIAKGYAVQEITKWVKENLWTSCVINIGGNVSTCGFKNDDGSTLWTVGIENPDLTADDYLLKVKITDSAVVTSGDYQRYYVVDNKKYCHIINPETLMPSEYVASVSVICNDSALGDALSTTLFNMSIDEGLKLVDGMDGVEAVWVDKEFNKTFSENFEKYIVKEET